MTLPKDNTLTKSQSISKAWKDRMEYTDGLYGTPFHNTWRSMMFTIKGKKIGISDDWKKFSTFKKDMLPSYEDGLRICRNDKSKPFSKENCKWVDKSLLSQHRMNKITYNGEEKTIIEWCLQHDLEYNGVRQRYFRGKNYTAHEILFGKIKKPKRELINAGDLSLASMRIKASKMISAYKCKDKKRGFQLCDFTIEWLIENIFKKPCSYCGSTENIGADRLDNKQGHIMNNVVPCCFGCNIIKGDRFDANQMRKIGQFIKENGYFV